MNMRFVSRSLALLFCLSMFLAAYGEGGRTPLRAKNGIVASASEIASQVGVDIMKQGGNAMDATIATAVALAVTWPTAGNTYHMGAVFGLSSEPVVLGSISVLGEGVSEGRWLSLRVR